MNFPNFRQSTKVKKEEGRAENGRPQQTTNPPIQNQDLVYNYDAVGNRTSTIINGVTTQYTTNNLNEYTSVGGVGYQYAVTKDPRAREIGGQILKALRILQEVTGKPGLLCRGYVKGHGPVVDWERDGGDSKEWHQGQGQYADYRFYSDVSVDNFNAVMYGYAIYYDLAADAAQRAIISHDVDRLMAHLLDNHYRIVDLNGEVTQYGHVGLDPDPARGHPPCRNSGKFF